MWEMDWMATDKVGIPGWIPEMPVAWNHPRRLTSQELQAGPCHSRDVAQMSEIGTDSQAWQSKEALSDNGCRSQRWSPRSQGESEGKKAGASIGHGFQNWDLRDPEEPSTLQRKCQSSKTAPLVMRGGMTRNQPFGCWDLFWFISLCPVPSTYSPHSVIFFFSRWTALRFWVTINSMIIQHPKWTYHFDRALGTQRPKIGSGVETPVFLGASAEGHWWVQGATVCVSTSSY